MVLYVEHFAVRPVYVDQARRTTELTTESPQVGGKHAWQRDILVAKTPQGTFFGRREIFLVAKTAQQYIFCLQKLLESLQKEHKEESIEKW